jgi:hypothetical protein
MNQKLLALYGLKWNPFSPELPTEAIFVPPKLEDFCWRIEHAQTPCVRLVVASFFTRMIRAGATQHAKDSTFTRVH